MKKYGIPTAQYEILGDYDSALAYIRSKGPLVVKPTAPGQGRCGGPNRKEAEAALRSMMMVLWESGSTVVIECMTAPR